MPLTSEPIGSSFLKEDDDPRPKFRLARSPHPYHRQSIDISKEIISNGFKHKTRHAAPSPLSPIVAPSAINTYRDGLEYFDTDSRKRRKVSASPSGSGTEADDERGSLLKGLPAPPTRPRKGLKASGHLTTSATQSPLLTPSCIDTEERKVAGERHFKTRGGLQKTGALNYDEVQKVREKLTRRKRAELLRRISESICIMIVGYITVRGTHTDNTVPLQVERGSTLLNSRLEFAYSLPTAVVSHIALVAGIYAIYPIRLLWHLFNASSGMLGIERFQIPAAFDPAPLLYPILLPLFAVVSLSSKVDEFLLPNIILSISSIPPALIPLNDHAFKSVQCMLSTIPLFLSTSCFEPSRDMIQPSQAAVNYTFLNVKSEHLVLLPLLHQTLLPTLGFMTTTSLLPAELQLLSVALINLLTLSTSPQAIILKALLWIGPLSILLAGRHVLKWSVAIARVPSWRFRPSRTQFHQNGYLLPAIDDYLGGRLTAWGLLKDPNDSSEDDDILVPRIRYMPEKSIKFDDLQTTWSLKPVQPFDPSTNDIAVADDDHFDARNQQGVPITTVLEPSRVRRHTLPSYVELPPAKSELQNAKTNAQGRTRPRSKHPNSFLALTIAQAQVLKRLYASYVYVLVIATIALPIKLYISYASLHDNEPVGWALGYLFGDLPSFRLWTHLRSLERWICLPPRAENEQASTIGWADGVRQDWGAANTRLIISAYCITIVTIGMFIVLRLSSVAEVDTRRKVFHGMMVAMFLPTIFIDPAFAALSLALVLAIFLLLDLFRASQLPPLSKPLTYFLAPYVDGRDHRGPVIVSHIFLLIGCAIPLWMSLAATERTGTSAFEGWDVATRDLSMISGVVCVGMGDAAASLIGRRYGRRKWAWSGGKSVEGSLAFALAVVLGLCISRLWLLTGGWVGDRADPWGVTLAKAAVAAIGASFTEAVLTGGNDNVVVPIILWLLVRGLNM
ncbi:hypothetical protein MMC14_001819 [Varicellaria rhodocarpa]|nr:hypothetical protein [Varicellaria rhodocarpa]